MLFQDFHTGFYVNVLHHKSKNQFFVEKGNIIYPETPEYMKSRFKKLQEVGVDIIGGCCGTTAEHIREIVKVIKN